MRRHGGLFDHVQRIAVSTANFRKKIHLSQGFSWSTFGRASTVERDPTLGATHLLTAIALLHQHQRERKSRSAGGKTIQYIEVARGDIALANMIVSALMGSSIDDLPTQKKSNGEEIKWVRSNTVRHNDCFKRRIC